MNRREFLKLASAVPFASFSPLSVLANPTDPLDYIHRISMYGLGESSSMAIVSLSRGSNRPLAFPLNAWGGSIEYICPIGHEIVWSEDIKIGVEGLAIADIYRKDKIERYSPYGLISSQHIRKVQN